MKHFPANSNSLQNQRNLTEQNLRQQKDLEDTQNLLISLQKKKLKTRSDKILKAYLVCNEFNASNISQGIFNAQIILPSQKSYLTWHHIHPRKSTAEPENLNTRTNIIQVITILKAATDENEIISWQHIANPKNW